MTHANPLTINIIHQHKYDVDHILNFANQRQKFWQKKCSQHALHQKNVIHDLTILLLMPKPSHVVICAM
jgi:hypothetical protein